VDSLLIRKESLFINIFMPEVDTGQHEQPPVSLFSYHEKGYYLGKILHLFVKLSYKGLFITGYSVPFYQRDIEGFLNICCFQIPLSVE